MKLNDVMWSIENAELKHKVRVLELLLEVCSKINVLDSKRCLNLILRHVAAITRAQRGFIILLDSSGGNLELALDSHNQTCEVTTLSFSRSVTDDVIQSGRGMVVENLPEDNHYKNKHSISDLNLKAVMCVPLKIHERVIGVIYLDSDSDDHCFSQDDLRFYEAFAAQAALSIENARIYERLKKEKVLLQREVEAFYRLGEMVCAGKRMEDVIRLTEHVLDNDITILIQGETGTGKEVLARAIHLNGARWEKCFFAQNCGVMTESLLESELFGHRKGAFTGAAEDKPGIFEATDGGTIFLDEIGETPLSMQVALLRVLETGMVRRIGETKDRKVNVRIIAATNRDLQMEVEAGRFREDLFYRLNVFPIHIPPLRERREDIPILVHQFVGTFNKELNKNVTVIPQAVMNDLTTRYWRGNIRELKNLIYRLMVLSDGNQLSPDNLSLGSAPLKTNGIPDPYRAMIQEGIGFWEAVRDPYLRRDLNREQVKAVIQKGLSEVKGGYKELMGLFQVSDYRKFINFLNKHRLT